MKIIKLNYSSLEPNEASAVLVARRWVSHSLNVEIQSTDLDHADIAVIDPETHTGQQALTMTAHGLTVICVVDRSNTSITTMLQGKKNLVQIFRPLRPSGIVKHLKALIEPDSVTPASDKQASRSKTLPLGQAIREAMLNSAGSRVHVIEGLGNQPLVIDVNRDQIRGFYQLISTSLTASDNHVTTYDINAEKAVEMSASAPQTSLYRYLWHVGHDLTDQQLLSSELETASFRLNHWPDLNQATIPHKHVRVLTLLRYRHYTLKELIDVLGKPRTEITPILNAAWLTGELQVEPTAESQKQRKKSNPNHHKTSLLERIRSRLGMAHNYGT